MSTFQQIRYYGLIGRNYLDTYVTPSGLFNRTPQHWHLVLVLLGLAIFGYLIGGLNFAVLISKKSYHEDIRDFGSKNAGTTNMMRTYGKKAAIATLLGDIGKGLVACLVGALLMGEAGGYFAGVACVVGHMYPVWFRFRGGKGIATTAAVILCMSPGTFGVLITLFILIVLWTKFISLGSIIGMLFYPLVLDRFSAFAWSAQSYFVFPLRTAFAILVMLLVIWKHRSNIQRLLEHRENKFSFHSSREKAAVAQENAQDVENESQDTEN